MCTVGRIISIECLLIISFQSLHISSLYKAVFIAFLSLINKMHFVLFVLKISEFAIDLYINNNNQLIDQTGDAYHLWRVIFVLGKWYQYYFHFFKFLLLLFILFILFLIYISTFILSNNIIYFNFISNSFFNFKIIIITSYTSFPASLSSISLSFVAFTSSFTLFVIIHQHILQHQHHHHQH